MTLGQKNRLRSNIQQLKAIEMNFNDLFKELPYEEQSDVCNVADGIA